MDQSIILGLGCEVGCISLNHMTRARIVAQIFPPAGARRRREGEMQPALTVLISRAAYFFGAAFDFEVWADDDRSMGSAG